MNIVKELSLGKNYKSVTNGSLVAARNICIDNDTTNIIRENGLIDKFQGHGKIVGVIPTVKDLIVFTYDDNKNSHIFIVNNDTYKIKTCDNHNWKHVEGTKFIGDYTTDPEGRYVVAICEYVNEAEFKNVTAENFYTKYPLKSWTLVEDDDNSTDGLIRYTKDKTLNINPDIPKFNVDRYIKKGGNLITGVYTFFIRFKINNYDYTNWFQLTDDIIITNYSEKSKPKHFYQIGFALDKANTENFKSYIVNKEGYSPYYIKIILQIIDECIYNSAEIAYIFKHEASVVGRHVMDISLSNNNNISFQIYNNNFINEVSVDELLKPVVALFNVKSLCNYSNRLYCSNYLTHYNETEDDINNYINTNKDITFDDTNIYIDNRNNIKIDKDKATLYFEFMYHSDSISYEKEVEIEKQTKDSLKNYGLSGVWYKVSDIDTYTIFHEMFNNYIVDYSDINASGNSELENFNLQGYACDTIYEQDNPGKSDDDADQYVVAKLSVLISAASKTNTPTGTVLWWNGDVRLKNKNNTDTDYIKNQPTPTANTYYTDYIVFMGDMLYSTELSWPDVDKLVYNKSTTYDKYAETYSRDTYDSDGNPIPAFNLYVNEEGIVALLDKTYSLYTSSNMHNAVVGTKPTKFVNSTTYPKALKLNDTSNYNISVGLLYRALRTDDITDTFTITDDNNATVTIGLYKEQTARRLTGQRKKCWNRWLPRIIFQNNDKTIVGYGDVVGYKPKKYNNAKLICNASVTLVSDINNLYNVDNNTNITSVIEEDYIFNCRTLVPIQKYNIFKHFIRSDYTVTLGYNVGTVKINTIVPNNIYKFKINNEKGFDENKYIGYFYTYEDIIKSVNWNIFTQIDNKYYFTNCRVIFDDLIYHFPNVYKQSNISLLVTYVQDKFNKLSENAIEINESLTERKIYYTYKDVSYDNEIKTLFKLTPRYFTTIHNWTNEYLPGFINRELSILYSQNIIANADSLSISSIQQSQVDYDIANVTDFVYSDVPIFAYNVKQDYEIIKQTFIKSDNSIIGTYTNNVILPNKIGDFLEIQTAYTSKPNKTYTNYQKAQYLNRFPTTIWRSNQINDENYENRFRQYETEQYRIIHENKGSITNIIGVGTILIIHTENSIFQFDRSPKLSSKLTPEIKDTFDVEYSEMFPTQNGYGGLQDNYDCLVCPAGYIWYDSLTKNIFKFDAGTPKVLSQEIDDFIKKLDIVNVRFAYDNYSNRLLICIWYVANGSNLRELKNCQTITLSYDFKIAKFISLHDYSFTRGYNTYNKLYLFNDVKENSKLFVFDKESVSYCELEDIQHSYIPSFTIDGTYASYIDVIVNAAYETTKCIESINYILNTIDKSLGLFDNISRQKKYSGNALCVYSDSCYSGLLDIFINNKTLNQFNNYKYPYYNKGTWNINYFRNRLSTDDLEVNNVKETKTTIVVQDTSNNFTIKEISMEELRKQQALDNTDDKLNGSDNKSLIYGKYIVVRLIIDRKKDFVLETLNINLNQY